MKKKSLNQLSIGLTAAALMLVFSSPSWASVLGNREVVPLRVAQIGQRGEPYILGPGDRVQMDIFNVPEYSGQNGQHRILPDGTLSLPLLPVPIPVQGLTLQQAAGLISEQYRPFLTSPIVTLILVEPRPINIAVAGEVNRPGSYALGPLGFSPGGQSIQLPTLTRALQAAGGTTISADIRNIQIQSVSGAGGSFDLSSLSQQANLAQDLPLRDGDRIFVPPLTSLTPQQASQLALTSFSGDPGRPVNITVVGEVNRPGPYVVTRVDQSGGALTVSRAIQTAGGLTGVADLQRVQIQRLTQTGIAQTINVNLLAMIRGTDLSQDVLLATGDTIFVPTIPRLNLDVSAEVANTSLAGDPTRPLNIAITGEVNRPGSYTIQRVDDKGGQLGLITVTRALQTAGGITQSADLRRIQIRRPTRQGTEQVINVDLWQLLQAGDLKQDVILGQGDTIVVPTSNNVNTAELAQLAVTNFVGDSTRTLNIAVTGEVNRPGSYTLQRSDDKGGQLGLITVTRALQTAGGLTQSADLRRIQIRRPTRQNTEQVINVDLWQLLQAGDLKQDVTLGQGDTIVVPTSNNVNTAELAQLAVTSFAGDSTRPLNIAVTGEVNRPGSYTLQRSDDKGGQFGLITVTRALQNAGGITQTADIRRIQVRRPTRQGTERVIDVNLWQLLQAGDLNQDVILDQGDTIVVPTAETVDLTETAQIGAANFSPATIRVNLVGEVVRPGAVEVPANTSLNQALLAAGGFNQLRAKTQEVELIRLNPNGTVSRRSVEVDFSQEMNEKNNPSLRPNDVIVVGRSKITSLADSISTVLSPVTNLLGVFRVLQLFGL